MDEKILVVDFGSQYTQLIATRLRSLNVYSEIFPWNNLPSNNVIPMIYKGVILSGGPSDIPYIDFKIFGNLPVLGICYGAQLMAIKYGASVTQCHTREYGRTKLHLDYKNKLFQNLPENIDVWMSHQDTIHLPQSIKFEVEFEENKELNLIEILAKTNEIPIAAFKIKDRPLYGLQFHPEVTHTTFGTEIFTNFVKNICKLSQSWAPKSMVYSLTQSIRQQIQDKSINDITMEKGTEIPNVIMALSGGVDSTVAATLIHKVIPNNLFCVFVDNGFLRKNEYKEVLEFYKNNLHLNVIGVDASDIFFSAVKDVSDPELKRKAIGKAFITVFEEKVKLLEQIHGKFEFLGQGTIYPDIIESAIIPGKTAQTIKSHHNVGGLPDTLKLSLIEPLKLLFKDDVRRVGRELNLPSNVVNRHPFPGPGLAIRIPGAVTRELVKILQEADYVYINALKDNNFYDKIWQAGSSLLPIKTVGVMGDQRTYEYMICLRAVTSNDAMTADVFEFPPGFMTKLSTEIINKVNGVNRVVYDISSKPPATIEIT